MTPFQKALHDRAFLHISPDIAAAARIPFEKLRLFVSNGPPVLSRDELQRLAQVLGVR